MWHMGPGHLLITDVEGRQIGFVGDEFVEEVPGAFASVPPGGLGAPAALIYYLPLTNTHTILLDGQTLVEAETVAITQFGPGHAVWVDDVLLEPGSQDHLSIAPDGTHLAYQASAGKQATLALALETASDSTQLRLDGADIGTGETVTMTADVDSGQLVFDNAHASGGEYDLWFERLDSTGEQKFFHADLIILGTDTHFLDYGAWDGLSPMTLSIDHGSDGSIDETLELENQIMRIYLPLVLRSY
jgi:hypothetical protein